MLQGYNEWDSDLHTLPFLACVLTKLQSQMILYLLALLSMFQTKKIECWVVGLSHSFETDNIYLFDQYFLNAHCVLGTILFPYNIVINKIHSTVINK